MKKIDINIKGQEITYHADRDSIVDDTVIHADISESVADLFYLRHADSYDSNELDITSEDHWDGKSLYNIYERGNSLEGKDISESVDPIMDSVGKFLPKKDLKLWKTIIGSNIVEGKDAIDLLRNRKTLPAMIANGNRLRMYVNGERYGEYDDYDDAFIERFLAKKRPKGDEVSVEFAFEGYDHGFLEVLINELKKNGAPIFMVMCQEHGNKYYSITEQRSYEDKFDSGYAGFMLADEYWVEEVYAGRKTVAEVREVCSSILSEYNDAYNGEIYEVVSEEITLSNNPLHIQNTGDIELSGVIAGYDEARKQLFQQCHDRLVTAGEDPEGSDYIGVRDLAKERLANKKQDETPSLTA